MKGVKTSSGPGSGTGSPQKGAVLLADMLAPFEVGDGPSHLEDAGEGAGGKAKPVGDKFQHPVAGSVQFAVLPEMAGIHLGVTVDFVPLIWSIWMSRERSTRQAISAELSASLRSERSR
jgi:hypothetical protein